jgi:hypothetical protein
VSSDEHRFERYNRLRVFDWLRKLGTKKLLPLAGAPKIRRQKTYSAQSGYVYQYFYEGYRPALHGSEPGEEFVFQVTADRETFFPVSVFVQTQAIEAWQQHHGRELNSTERYAIAKMALFQAFDDRSGPQDMRQEVQVRSADVEGILQTLGLE